jgi:hypothetical protein
MDIWFILWVCWTVACILFTIKNVKAIIVRLREERIDD